MLLSSLARGHHDPAPVLVKYDLASLAVVTDGRNDYQVGNKHLLFDESAEAWSAANAQAWANGQGVNIVVPDTLTVGRVSMTASVHSGDQYCRASWAGGGMTIRSATMETQTVEYAWPGVPVDRFEIREHARAWIADFSVWVWQ